MSGFYDYEAETQADTLLRRSRAAFDPGYPAHKMYTMEARHRKYRAHDRYGGSIENNDEILAPDPFVATETMDLVDDLLRRAKLTDRERAAYALHHYAQAPPPDGAVLMGVSLRSYFDYRASAQRKLAAVVAAEEKEGETDG